MLTKILTTQKERDELSQQLKAAATFVTMDDEDLAFLQEGAPVTEWQVEVAPSSQKSRMKVLLQEWKTVADDLSNVKKIVLLLQFSQEHSLLMSEMQVVQEMFQSLPDTVSVQWGAGIEDTLGEKVRLTAVVQNFNIIS